MTKPTKQCELCHAAIVKEEPGDDSMHCPECDAVYCKNCMPGHKFYVCCELGNIPACVENDYAKNPTT
jgi:hypothetical protein